ncbi:MAG TPA: FHA domain-containing protein, partial [Vicinamibacteria bacterium]|nr:FHA domain-containing protein [Vicinamibacteria bacterium]
MAVLRLVPLAGAPIELDRDQAIVGREPGCDVFVNDGSVSRRHARLDRRGAAWFVVDQGSANGTYLDSQRVSDALLRPGQELRFGAVSFKVEIVGGGAPSAEGTILTPGGAMPYPPAPPAPPRPGVPPPPQWPGAPAPPAPPRPVPAAPAYPAPSSPAGVPPRLGGPPPGRPSGPPPPASTDTAPYAAGAPVRRPRPPRPVAEASAGPPAKPGRGPLFWGGVGCGGCLAVLFLLGAILGGFIYF